MLVVAASALRVTQRFVSISLAMVECSKEETNCGLGSIGELSLLFLAKSSDIAVLGNRLSWVGLLQNLQICRVLLVSGMRKEAAGGEAAPAAASSRGLPRAAISPTLQPI